VSSLAPPVDPALSVQTVAALLRVCEDTVRKLLRAGEFPSAFRAGGKLIRIPRADFDAYRERTRLQRAPDPGPASRETDVALPFEGRV